MAAYVEQATARGPMGSNCAEGVGPRSAKQVWWSFELKALSARFAGATSVKDAGIDSEHMEIEVDLSHVLSTQQGSLVIEAIVSSGYPQVRPRLTARVRPGLLESGVIEEMAKCMVSAMESALAVNGPAVFFSIDQAAAFLRCRNSNAGTAQIGGDTSKQREEASAEKRPRRRRRQRKPTALLPVCENGAKVDEAPPSPACQRTKALGGGSLSTGISTPSSISDASSPSSSELDDGSSSSSYGVSDDEMKSIADQLHFNVRRQLLFKRNVPARGKARPP